MCQLVIHLFFLRLQSCLLRTSPYMNQERNSNFLCIWSKDTRSSSLKSVEVYVAMHFLNRWDTIILSINKSYYFVNMSEWSTVMVVLKK